IAKTSRERLKRQPSSRAAATTVKGKTVARPVAVPRSAGMVSSSAAATRIRTSGTSLETRRFIGPVTVRVRAGRSTAGWAGLTGSARTGDIHAPPPPGGGAVSSRGLGRSPLKAQTRVRIPLPLLARPHRLTARTPLFQGGNRGSIPLGGIEGSREQGPTSNNYSSD